jgi:hypothetical protein
MADPWKAIADMIYCRKKNWGSINDLMVDLRIEEDSIKNHKLISLSELSKTYPHKFTRKTLQIFFKELK